VSSFLKAIPKKDGFCYLRWRKDTPSRFCYSVNMEPVLDSGWTAEQVMERYPRTVAVFLALKTGCVGCHLERFCTLAEVAETYQLPLQTLLEKLNESIHKFQPHEEIKP
jgi:hybrid cluster-associated redox disulfide protein